MNKWISSLIGDIILFGALFLGEIQGFVWAHNIAIFLLWASVLVMIMMGVMSLNKDTEDHILKTYTKNYKLYNNICNIILLLCVIGLGWFVTAICLTIGISLYNNEITRILKENS